MTKIRLSQNVYEVLNTQHITCLVEVIFMSLWKIFIIKFYDLDKFPEVIALPEKI